MNRDVSAATLLALAAVLGLYALVGDVDLGLHDEGYLWYGVQRTAAGEVPLRDFQSYDPGRYYWCAAGGAVFGDGILGVRRSLACFQAVALVCGLLAARRVASSPWALAGVAAILALWLFPRYKAFESGFALIATLFAVRLIERPSAARHFASGALVGATAFFGRNLALYVALSHAAVIGLVLWKQQPERPLRGLAAWLGGGVLGFVPMIALLAAAPGFAASYADSLVSFTTLPSPIPWPWRLALNPPAAHLVPAASAISASFVLLVLVYPLGALVALSTRAGEEELPRRALFVASICVGAAWSHHALVRADAIHLASSIQPLLLALLAAPAALGWEQRTPRAVAFPLAVALLTGLVAFGGGHPRLRLLVDELEPYRAAGESLRLPPTKAAELRAAETFVRTRVPYDAPILIAPYRPVYYPLLGRTSPVWSLFFLRPGEGESDGEIVRKLEQGGVDWVLFVDETPPAGVVPWVKLRAGVLAYLQRTFDIEATLDGTPQHVLLHRKSS